MTDAELLEFYNKNKDMAIELFFFQTKVAIKLADLIRLVRLLDKMPEVIND